MKLLKPIATGVVVAMLSACGGEETKNNYSETQEYHNILTTLQGSVFDAITNQRLTDESLKVTLVQGTKYRSAKVRKGEAEFAGDYAITSIPTTTDENGPSATYRLVAQMEGYQTFETAVQFATDTENLQDRTRNVLGNIYMFPVGSYAADVTVKVVYNDEPVANATVLLQPQTANNELTANESNRLFEAELGFNASLQTKTDAQGKVTFSADKLILGGKYKMLVISAKHEGIVLAPESLELLIGTAETEHELELDKLSLGNDNGLYIAEIDNQDSDKVNSTGELKITFSRPVSLVKEGDIRASLENATTAVINASNSPDSTATAVLSTDGLELTLTPNFATAPQAYSGSNDSTADNGLKVAYSNIQVRLLSENDTGDTYSVASLKTTSGNIASLKVKATVSF